MRASLAFGMIGLVSVSGAAVAAPDVSFEVTGTRVLATVDGGPRAPVGSITLGVEGHHLPALVVQDYAVGAEPIAIALVVNGQEIWMGNDDIETDENARYVGVLNSLSHAIDAVGLAAVAPAGSQISVVSYSTGAEYLVHDKALATFTGAALGTQRDYRNKIGTDMVQGIELAIADLEAARAPRKALIVIGDGNDTNDETAVPMLTELKRDAAIHGISTFAIVYKSVVSADGQVITRMVPATKTVSSVAGISAALSSIVARLADRQYVYFDATALPWDGHAHDITLEVAGEQISTQAIVLPASAEPWWRAKWLAELGLGVLLAGLFAAFTRWRVLAVK